MRNMARIGIVLILVGFLTLLGYGMYSLLVVIYSTEDIPLIIRMAVPIIIGGLMVLIVSVVRDRLRDRRNEKFREVKY
tara:strand:- start:114 stop:347 length:234 start_codon:yes stop_codon:yes gene_type:complete